MAKHVKIRSGGQSGVDRAALNIAVELELPYTGWCPRGGWAEDFPTAPGLLARFPEMTATPSADPMQRTAWNVRDSDATLLLVRRGLWDSPGTIFTRVCAELIFTRPFLAQDLDANDAHDRVRAWAASLRTTHDGELTLNVGGPRESQSPGIYESARVFLKRLFASIGS